MDERDLNVVCARHEAGNAHLNSEGGSFSTGDLLALTG